MACVETKKYSKLELIFSIITMKQCDSEVGLVDSSTAAAGERSRHRGTT